MKRLDRADLRGCPLDKDCYEAYRCSHIYGSEDNRVFCCGRYKDKHFNIDDKCLSCKAYVYNSEPLDTNITNKEMLKQILSRINLNSKENLIIKVFANKLEKVFDNYEKLSYYEKIIGCPLDVYAKLRKAIVNNKGELENVISVFETSFKTYNFAERSYKDYKYSEYGDKWFLPKED